MLTVGCIRVVNYQPPGLSIPKAQGLRDQYLRVLPCINGSPKASDFVQQRGWHAVTWRLTSAELLCACAGIWVGLAGLEQASEQAAVCEHRQPGSPCAPGALLQPGLQPAMSDVTLPVLELVGSKKPPQHDPAIQALCWASQGIASNSSTAKG